MVKLQWPNITLGGNVDLAEVPDHNKLSYQGEINLVAAPFLGVKIDVDIKNIIMRILETSSPFGVFLTEILAIAKKGYKGKFASAEANFDIKLKAGADIKGDLQWKREPAEGQWKTDKAKSSIGESMSITIYGDVHVKGHLFTAKGAAGASIHLRSYDGKEASKFDMTWAALEGMENPSLERQMSFNGLAIYYSAYARAGTDDTAAGKATQKLFEALAKNDNDDFGFGSDDDKTVKDDKEKSDDLISKGSEELKELCKLMQEWKSTDKSTEIGKDDV